MLRPPIHGDLLWQPPEAKLGGHSGHHPILQRRKQDQEAHVASGSVGGVAPSTAPVLHFASAVGLGSRGSWRGQRHCPICWGRGRALGSDSVGWRVLKSGRANLPKGRACRAPFCSRLDVLRTRQSTGRVGSGGHEGEGQGRLRGQEEDQEGPRLLARWSLHRGRGSPFQANECG